MYSPKTHFDQIPVERVKEIAEPLLDSNESENVEVMVLRTQDGGTAANNGWRAMARQIQKETDPTKLIGLVQQLIARFDEQEQRTSLVPAEKNVTATEETRTPSAD